MSRFEHSLGDWPGSTLFSGSQVRVDDHPWRWPHPRRTPLFRADYDQVVLPRRGMWTKHSHGRSVLGDPTDAVFYHRGEEYQYDHHDEEGACTYLIVARDTVRSVLRETHPAQADSVSPSLGLCCPVDGKAAMWHARLLPLARLGLDALAIEELVLQIITRLAKHSRMRLGFKPCTQTATDRRHRELAESALVLLSRTFRQSLSLAELARTMGATPYHLARVFRRVTGRSIHGHRHELRLRAALEPLLDGVNTTDLALSLGFSSRSHFSDAFRREYGISPKDYRRHRGSFGIP